MNGAVREEFAVPAVVDRGTVQAELDAPRVREKAHTREGVTLDRFRSCVIGIRSRFHIWSHFLRKTGGHFS
jgi:hypothetical protein